MNTDQVHLAASLETARADETRSLRDLAEDACKLPWEDKAPIMTRIAFKEAITPEVFMELVSALKGMLDAFYEDPFEADQAGAAEKAYEALAKATGEPQ